MTVHDIAMACRARALRAAFAACIGAVATTHAAAHYIWLERDAKGARLYFGEIDEVREISPGRLDEIKSPSAWAGTAASTLKLARTATHITLQGAPAPQLFAHELGVEVKDWSRQGIGVVKPNFYARHSAWPLSVTPAPQHRLDIVPVGGSDRSFRVFLNGQPLPKAKVALRAPNDWSQEHGAGEDGVVSLSMPWRGRYLLEVVHKEDTGGEFEGRRYDAIRHRATLSVVQPKGVAFLGTGGGAAEAATRVKLAEAAASSAQMSEKR